MRNRGTTQHRDPFDFEEWTSRLVGRPPLNGLPFTPLLSCVPALSLLMDRFDWRVVPVSGYRPPRGTGTCSQVDDLPWNNYTRMSDPRTVWAAPHAVQRLLAAAASGFDTRHRNRVVLFSGTEMPLSVAFGRTAAERNATVRKLRRYFSLILYEVKDIPLEGVRLAPIGLSWGYMLFLFDDWLAHRTDPRRGLADLAKSVRANLTDKTRGVLASWGKRAGWLDDPETIGHVRHFAARGLLYPASNSSLQAVAAAWESRRRLRFWAATTAARDAGVEVQRFNSARWWAELPKYRFLLSPLGSGIQTAKVVEALLVLTVPIVQHMNFTTFYELAGLGFPIVVVTGWVEVTRQNTERWWRALAPRLESFRRNCLSNEGYWRMYTSPTGRCM